MEFAPAVAEAGRVGQGTVIEQSRAIAEVQALVVIARQYPRDRRSSTVRMLDACAQVQLAKKAFYAFPRGDDTISGLTIDAVAELAQAWGNIDYGLTELRRDDIYGQSEMQAFAWDLETNVRHTSRFIVQHVRETKRGNYKVTSPRDIYEVNANMGNRRMRAAVLKVLPRWYKLEAEEALKATLAAMVKAGGKSLAQRIEDAVAWFGTEFAVTRDQLEYKRRRPSAQWGDEDLVQLRILGDSLKRKDLALDEAFPQAKVTAEELAPSQEANPGPVADAPAETPPVEHLDHPEGDWMDGCPGCVAESDAVDQGADDGDA
jgi:hypothetical protein